MIFLLVSFLSLLLLLTTTLSLQLPSWVSEMRLLSALLCQEFLSNSIQWSKNYRLVCTHFLKFSSTMSTNKNRGSLEVENLEEEADVMTILDLPELALDLILEKLSPSELISMAKVCSSLRGRCRSEHLWKRHFDEKWGRVVGSNARRELESFLSSFIDCKKNQHANWLVGTVSCVWPCSWFGSKVDCRTEENSHLRVDSFMAWYLALESGKFWLPAQVYNRENGNVGFMLSCYDTELSYDPRTDTFHARYPPHGQRGINMEEGVQWDRIRAPPVNTSALDLHASDCLNDLRPGDHIEIQWRRNKEYPYGWWYGVVGHLETCDGDQRYCRCFNSDTVIVEFHQYSPNSRWRRTVVNRKDHREEGSESDGFYGGVRKVHDRSEISNWRRLWPTDVLE